jgi:DNA-binding beta-propeller fold protein YncE
MIPLFVACFAGGQDVDAETTVGTFGSDPTFTVVAQGGKFATPRDLEFHPDRPDELFVVNRDTDSVTVITNPGTPDQKEKNYADVYGNHFMEEVSSLAMGVDDTFATCQESRNTYDGDFPADDFMGPALWPAGLDVLAQVEQGFGDLLGSHLDMLHQSPFCMGIAHDKRNVYWVFDGYNGNLVRYDFADDHGYGYDDHSDGVVWRYSEVDLDRVAGVPGHLVLDDASGLLYVADTGSGRVLAVDTGSGRKGDALPELNEPLAEYVEMENVDFSVLVEGLDEPSGIAIDGDRLFVSEHGTGTIIAYDLAGTELDAIAVPEGPGVMGLEIGPDGALWYVHGDAEKVVRVDAG